MPNRLTITIDLDNSAFYPDPVPEILRVLSRQALRLDLEQSYNKPLPIRDSNGNTVGTFLWQTEGT